MDVLIPTQGAGLTPLAQLGVSGVLMLLMRAVFMVWETAPNKIKTIITLISGIGVGIGWIFYQGIDPIFPVMVDSSIEGLQAGMGACVAYDLIHTRRNQ